MDQNILTLVILGHFLPFYPLKKKNAKIKILKSEKICWRYDHFMQVYQKSQSYDVCFLRQWSATDRIFCHYEFFFAFLLPPPMDPENLNFEKLKRKNKQKQQQEQQKRHLKISFYKCLL